MTIPAVEVTPAARGPIGEPPARRVPVTLRTIAAMVARGERFAGLTCYDYTTARWLDRAGVPLLLVGDTAAEMILGLPGTIHAPLDLLLALTAAVRRGAEHALVMGDMPFLSYQVDEAEAIRNAGRFLVEGRCDCVKLEVDGTWAPLVAKLARAGIPVVAHIGCRPQHVKRAGGYSAAGRTAAEAGRLVEEAVMMEEAGASMLLVEATPNEVSERIVARTTLPVLSCGAGPACHGQIVVLQDLLGLTDWQPSFARPIADHAALLTDAATRWIEKVRRNDLGEHPYRMKEPFGA